MAPKATTKWDEETYRALCLAFFVNTQFTVAQQAAIEQAMKSGGLPTTWEAIRSTTISCTMAPSGNKKWDDATNAHLFMTIFEVLDYPTFTAEHKEAIVAKMKEKFDDDKLSWNGIRTFVATSYPSNSPYQDTIMSTTTPAGRTIWTDKARSDLLQAIIEVAPPSSDEWTRIIQVLRQQGYTYNHNAALQHLQKLKRKDGPGNGNGNGAGTSSAQATPQKRSKAGKATSTTTTPKSGGRGRKRKAEPEFDDSDLDDKVDTKKPKIDTEAAVNVKDEVVGDDGADDGHV
ncbi:hypothetical protein F5Y18DRAFT_422403 [Xylariaceae sp. FL1019]|nr:hypothetical protein F5Y18DRAFT_422403 [Xylariaceae sp. FL1019]